MTLTGLQTDLLRRLQSAVAESPTRRVIYRSEWLGYLPFGVYHWIEINGKDLTLLPSDWTRTDLESLAEAGLLVKIAEWKNPMEEYDFSVTYEV